MILLIDNYDSFVYNLARYVGELGRDRHVVRNDAITTGAIAAIDGGMGPEAIILSPGPCTPDESGICMDIIRRFAGAIPILGVCLGHQCIAQVYGHPVVRGQRPVHGSSSMIRHDGRGLFTGLPNPMEVGRYHSLIMQGGEPGRDVYGPLNVTARTADGVVMALEHEVRPVYGVQFHPESILTPHGHKLLENFLDIASAHRARLMQEAAS